MKMSRSKSFISMSTGLAVVLVASCSWISRKSITSQYYKDRGEIIILTRNTPTAYYEDKTGETVGYEHDLVLEFAKQANVNARFVVKSTVSDLLEELRIGSAHLVAAAIPITEKIQKEFLVGPVHLKIEKKVLCHKNQRISSLSGLKGRTIVIAGEGEDLERREYFAEKYPDINWRSGRDMELNQWLEEAAKGNIECVLANSMLLDVDRRHFSDLREVVKLPETSELRWILPKGQKRLIKDLEEWIGDFEKNKTVTSIHERYFSPDSEYDFYDTEIFLKRVKETLPDLKAHFQKAAQKTSIDWRLLAAVGYQESHWNPTARSPTGVRGIMMLTRPTAEELGVDDRVDPEQSIAGGSEYLRKTMDRIPDFISEQDKLWFALAAYNVGWAHLKDARKLAIDLNLNPNRWGAMKNVLPLLSQAKYYKKLEHGYARGYEPVTYVNRIQRYYELLKIEFPR